MILLNICDIKIKLTKTARTSSVIIADGNALDRVSTSSVVWGKLVG